MSKNNFDYIRNLVEEIDDGFNKLKNEWKMKTDDEKSEIVERIYQTKVDHRLVESFSTVAEKATIRHMLEDMYK